MHCSMPFYIRDLNTCIFCYLVVGPGTSAPWIPRDYCSYVLGESKAVHGFSAVRGLVSLTPTLFKGLY